MLKVLAFGTSNTLIRVISSISGRDFQFVNVSTLPDAIKILNEDDIDIILIDSQANKSELVCNQLFQTVHIPVILFTPENNANWPDFCSYKVDGFISEDSSNTELIARLKASIRRKL
jgi:DNA-binding NarL/FixJ family response regulator